MFNNVMFFKKMKTRNVQQCKHHLLSVWRGDKPKFPKLPPAPKVKTQMFNNVPSIQQQILRCLQRFLLPCTAAGPPGLPTCPTLYSLLLLLITFYLPPITLLLITYYFSPTTYYRLPIAHYLLLTMYHVLLITYYSKTARYLLPTTYY